MGNSPIRGCTQVSTSVRLLQADGKVLEFVDPVLAIRVMQDYPGHSVVRFNATAAATRPATSAAVSSCTSHIHKEHHVEEVALGCSSTPVHTHPQPARRVAILRADEELQPGNTYYLLPVPRQGICARPSNKKPTFKSPKFSSKVGSSYEYEPERRSEKRSKSYRRSSSLPQAREMQQQHAQQGVVFATSEPMPDQSLGRMLMPGRSSSLSSNGASSSSQQQNSLQMEIQRTFDFLETRRYRVPSGRRIRRIPEIGWKPKLESIPECQSPSFQPRTFVPAHRSDRPRSAPLVLFPQAVQ